MPKVLKNVLSIDMDYIMAPTIQLYNDAYNLVESQGKNPQQMSYKEYWDAMEDITGVNEFLAYDEGKLQALTDLCLKVASEIPAENIYFGREHDSILTFLCGDIKKVDEIFNIFNIDHHHDIYYNDNQKANIYRFNYAMNANWVWYLKENKKLNLYYWIRNINSKRYPFINGNGCMRDLDEIEFRQIGNISEVKDLMDKQFDYMFICRSDDYLPFKFQSVFSGLKTQIEQVTKKKFTIDNDLYCGDDARTRFPVGTSF